MDLKPSPATSNHPKESIKPLETQPHPPAPKSAEPPRNKPYLRDLLQTLALDVCYERGAGDYLYYRNASGEEIAVLDLVGGYGSLLLGHSHPAIVAAAQRLLAGGCPVHAQGSVRRQAGQLAAELAWRTGGDYLVLFGNSGADAVEAAIKHAMLETGGKTFLALERGFHGKTLGALQLTANPHYRQSWPMAGLRVVHLPVNALERLEAAFAAATDLAGFIYEPIQGEGGIRFLKPEYLQRAAQLCAQRNIPVIADECQTGFGRTGTFLASSELGIDPDYVLLSKSLGGGLAKISATLIRRQRYQPEFDLKHTSTFAEDDFSCGIALQALACLDDDLLAVCRTKGEQFLTGLRRLAAAYPDIIAAVRGRGLMLGVEFRPLTVSPSFLLRLLSSQEELGYAIVGHLFHRHRIRVAPTLSDRFTLRLEPSALIPAWEIERVIAALEDVCQRLRSGDVAALTAHWQGEPAADPAPDCIPAEKRVVAYDDRVRRNRAGRAPARKVAWLCHLIDNDDLVSLEETFATVGASQREHLLARLARRSNPVVMAETDITSRHGEVVRLYPIMLPFTSRWVKRLLDRRELALPQRMVQDAVNLAAELGCGVVSLGQYTSIVTHNGLTVDSHGMGVTSGNSYAVALAIAAIRRAQTEADRQPAESSLVIVGAAGNIGRTCAELLAPDYRRTTLVGSDRPGSLRRLRELARRIPRANVATALDAVAAGNVVVAAINAVDAPLGPEHFSVGTIVCDLSVPSGLRAGLNVTRPNLRVIRGGIVSLPCGEALGIMGFPLPAGQTYACMAEGVVLGFENVRDSRYTGSLTAGLVAEVAGMAARHGFELADYKTESVLSPERKESCDVCVA